jgi:cytosine permease
MRVGAVTRLSTYVIIGRCFGRWGASCVNLLLATTLLGWYGVTVTLFGDAMAGAIHTVFDVEVASQWIIALGGVLMIVTTIYGFRAIDRLSRVAVPLLLILLLFSVWRVMSDTTVAQLLRIEAVPVDHLASIPAAVSVLIGAFIVGVTLTPDLARFCRRPADVLPASALSYGVGYPIILLLAGLPVLLQADSDLIKAIEQLGFGLLALVVMVFATWTTNVNNLYSASLGAAQVFPRVPDWLVTVVCGGVGTAMALAGIMNVFVGFLILLGVLVPPIAGVYLADFYGRGGSRVLGNEDAAGEPAVFWPAVISWCIASAWGVALFTNVAQPITGVAAIDTLVLSIVIYLSVCRLWWRPLQQRSDPAPR